jgi:BirA family biotin operon repressor/biotin-[acetyl-CoA-carboxylase] ligase
MTRLQARIMVKIEKIMSMLETKYVGREIHYFQKLSSTNTVAKEQAEKGAKEGTVIVAETQTQGHGRLNRPWISPKGGVWLSVILGTKIAAEEIPKMTLVTSVAVAKTLHCLYGLKTGIKWPNDVLIDGRKVSGILTEASTSGKNVNVIIVGIGINANFNLEALPDNLWMTATTLKKVLRKHVDREKLICVLLKEFEKCYKLFKQKKFKRLLDEWREMADFLGKKIEVTSLEENWLGRAIDIDESGALIVELENSERKTVLSGDVTIREI